MDESDKPLILDPGVLEDLRDIQQSMRNALPYEDVADRYIMSFLTGYQEALDAIERYPDDFAFFREPVRRYLMRSFDCRIFYEVEEALIYVYAVASTREHPSTTLRRLDQRLNSRPEVSD